MRTGGSLTVSRSLLWGGCLLLGGCLLPGGVSASGGRGVCLGGCLLPGGLPYRGVSASGEVYFQGICFCRGVIKFWKLVAHPGQWLTNLGGPDQIPWSALSIIIMQNEIEKKTGSYLSI